MSFEIVYPKEPVWYADNRTTFIAAPEVITTGEPLEFLYIPKKQPFTGHSLVAAYHISEIPLKRFVYRRNHSSLAHGVTYHYYAYCGVE